MSLIDYVTEKLSLLSETGTEDLMNDRNKGNNLMTTVTMMMTMMMTMISLVTHI